ncbi:MAG: SDR family oxidoreductase [Magnetococcus sp. YQC-9]
MPPTTALITGGARRIGAAITRALARRGLTVLIHHGHSPNEAEALAQKIITDGGEAYPIQADLADPFAVETLFTQAETLLKGRPVTLLVNNAAIFERNDLSDTPLEQWQRHLAINLTAPFLLMRDFARHLPEEHTGQIIQIIDRHADRPRPHYAAYSAAKSALWTLTRQAALEMAPRIRVNAIGPGPILPAPGDTGEQFARISAATPLQCAGNLEDITRTIHFLIDHDFLTGELIRVDGGEHLR